MAHNWHYDKGGEQRGPITLAQLSQLAKTRQLLPDDLVWREDMKDWIRASSVAELFPVASRPPALPPAPPARPSPPALPQPVPSPTDANRVASSPEPTVSPFRFAWAEWKLGGRVIFVSACVALVSMLMKWVDVGIASANGFSQGTFLLLGFFVYPMWMLLKQKPVNLYGGIGSAAGGMLFTAGYMSEKTVSFGERTAFLFGAGAVFFFLACGALAFGVYKYQQEH